MPAIRKSRSTGRTCSSSYSRGGDDFVGRDERSSTQTGHTSQIEGLDEGLPRELAPSVSGYSNGALRSVSYFSPGVLSADDPIVVGREGLSVERTVCEREDLTCVEQYYCQPHSPHCLQQKYDIELEF